MHKNKCSIKFCTYDIVIFDVAQYTPSEWTFSVYDNFTTVPELYNLTADKIFLQRYCIETTLSTGTSWKILYHWNKSWLIMFKCENQNKIC